MSKQEKSKEKIPQPDRELTEKQKRFCEEYLVDLNATQAAIRARYSKKSAYSIGQENLQKKEIRRYISESMKARSLRTQVTADRVLQELAKIAFAREGVKIKDKLKALDMLAKYLSFNDNQSKHPIFERLSRSDEFIIVMDKEERRRISEESEKRYREERARNEWVREASKKEQKELAERCHREQMIKNYRGTKREATRTGAKAGGNGEDQ